MTDLGSPADWGLPAKFSEWRPMQTEALSHIFAEAEDERTPPRFRVVQAPTGSGKTAYTMGLHAIRATANPEHRTLITTGTKALQDQYTSDDPSIVDIRGRNNYACDEYGDCELGSGRCSAIRRGDCNYLHYAVPRAQRASKVITNLAYWLALELSRRANPKAPHIGRFDTLVCDEAHGLYPSLTEYGTTVWSPRSGPKDEADRESVNVWALWADGQFSAAEKGLERARASRDSRRIRQAIDKLRRLQILKDATDDNFVVDPIPGPGGLLRISPVQPALFAERALYRGVPEVVLLSATVLPKTAELVGAVEKKPAYPDVSNGQGFIFEQYPLTFPASRWPIYIVKTVRVERRMSQSDKMEWALTINRIMAARGDRRGIAHTVSYQRAHELAKLLPPSGRGRMLIHARGDMDAGLESLAQSHNGVLFSPAITTGVDLPGRACEFIIWTKMPRPDSTGRQRLRERRREVDRENADYEMMMEFNQGIGRGMRGHHDQCEVFVVDDHARYLIMNHKDNLIPGWVDELIKWPKKGGPLPEPPPRLPG